VKPAGTLISIRHSFAGDRNRVSGLDEAQGLREDQDTTSLIFSWPWPRTLTRPYRRVLCFLGVEIP